VLILFFIYLFLFICFFSIHSFIYTSIHPSIHPFIYPSIQLFDRSINQSIIHSFIHSFIHAVYVYIRNANCLHAWLVCSVLTFCGIVITGSVYLFYNHNIVMTYLSSVQCSRKRVQQLKKCTKVMFLDFEKKNIKTLKRMCAVSKTT